MFPTRSFKRAPHLEGPDPVPDQGPEPGSVPRDSLSDSNGPLSSLLETVGVIKCRLCLSASKATEELFYLSDLLSRTTSAAERRDIFVVNKL